MGRTSALQPSGRASRTSVHQFLNGLRGQLRVIGRPPCYADEDLTQQVQLSGNGVKAATKTVITDVTSGIVIAGKREPDAEEQSSRKSSGGSRSPIPIAAKSTTSISSGDVNLTA